MPLIRAQRLTCLFPSLLLLVSTSLGAQSAPKGTAHGFRLFARALGAVTINRVHCGIDAAGELCVDSTGASTIGGGIWPKRSPQRYIHSSGLQVAGTIDTAGGWAWAGDTTGGFFFDPKGTTNHGQAVEPVWNYSSADDRAHWPQAAYVPEGDVSAVLYDPSLRGRPSASEGDLWTLMWEGDGNRFAGRPHPLGIAVETRVLGWNYPHWNNDVIYVISTLYNISSACPADYAQVRPGLREELLALGARFHVINEQRFGVQIPDCGFAIRDFHVGVSYDMDVSSDPGNNYSTVNLPLALSWTYEDSFRRPEFGYAPPPELGTAPFLRGYGFAGVKFLAVPSGAEQEQAIRLFSNTTGGGQFPDPSNVAQLFRYFSANITPALGDGLCNGGVPAISHVCYVKGDGHADMRSWQSAGPVVLAPGEGKSLAFAYLFASAVATGGCPAPGCGSVLPGNPLRLTDPAFLASQGANAIDSITGFRGYVDDNADGIVQGSEFRAVRGSLVGKAQLAQAIFDRGFLLPSAPAAPDFFLVPGDAQVAILWRPSTTEQTGDPYFTLAADTASVAYDPNFRQLDVEGYRIYRGRTADPAALTLVAQFDYPGTWMRDYLGTVNPGPVCAPELGRSTTAQGCSVDFSTPTPGGAYTVFAPNPIVGPFIQVKLGDRFLDAAGLPYTVAVDTAVTGQGAGGQELSDNGVPFSYIDRTVKNDLRYFYAVTAFDVNSIQSGPSSLESARLTRGVVPQAPGPNYDNGATLSIGVFGRGVNMSALITTDPRIDGTTGVFNGPARPATGAEIAGVGDFVKQLVTTSGASSLRLDSMLPGSAYDDAPSTFWFSIVTAAGTVPTAFTVTQYQFSATASQSGTIEGPEVDPAEAGRYGGSGDFHFTFAYTLSYPGNYFTAAYGRGCQNGDGFAASRCAYNGARWFDGAVESFPHPNRGNNLNRAAPVAITEPTNAGALAGVAHVYEARSYQTRPNTYRNVEGVLGTIATAADYKLYWGAGGTVDSVIDVTHNVALPFDQTMIKGYTWGFLTQAAASAAGSGDGRTGILSVTDLGCVAPIHADNTITNPHYPTGLPGYAAADGHLGCAATTHYHFVNTVSFGPLAYGVSVTEDGTKAAAANPGFGIYLAGHFFLIEMNSPTPTAPAAGTVWTMRSYVGAISGGGASVGTAGDLGAYSFQARPSPLTAVGASVTARYTITNVVRPATENDLAAVHTVPDPFYRTNGYQADGTTGVIKFVHLPTQAIIRIYTVSGILVRVIEHNSPLNGGSEDWDIRNRDGRLAASGVYFYQIEAPSGARRVGRMTLVTSGR